jgi:hypothetical protein
MAMDADSYFTPRGLIGLIAAQGWFCCMEQRFHLGFENLPAALSLASDVLVERVRNNGYIRVNSGHCDSASPLQPEFSPVVDGRNRLPFW